MVCFARRFRIESTLGGEGFMVYRFEPKVPTLLPPLARCQKLFHVLPPPDGILLLRFVQSLVVRCVVCSVQFGVLGFRVQGLGWLHFCG